MDRLWLLCRKLVLVSALLLAGMLWRAEVLAQSASLRLTWSDTSDNEDGFKIERLVAGLVDASLTVPANTGSYIDSALVAGTVYCYRVEAFNSAGDSDPSNQACAMAQGAIANTSGSVSVTASPINIPPGASTTASWSGIAAPTPTDWIGLYSPGAADIKFINWIYVSCSITPGSSRASGSCSYPLPTTLSAGTYELRLFANDGLTRLATSSSFTVTVAGTPSPSLTLNPMTAKPGATLTTTWSGINSQTPKDWIGLYPSGAIDKAFINWIYVSCSITPGSSRASGSCSYPLPTTMAAGTYELRLFANDGLTRIATSNQLTVSKSSSSTSVVLANAIGSGNGSTTNLLPEISREWTDYTLKLSLRSINNNSIGIMFRYQDDRNYYRFVWNQNSRLRRLEKIENGVAKVLAKDAVGYVKGRTYQAQIIAQGPTLRVFIDGAQIFSVTDSTFAEGTVGLYSSSNQVHFDNIVVQDLNTGAVLLSQAFDDGAFRGWTIIDQGRNRGPSAWSVVNGVLQQSSTIDDTFALYRVRNWRDYQFTVKLKSMDNDSIGVMFRYLDNNNYYRFAWNNSNSFRRVEKVVNGALTVLIEDTVPYVTGQAYQLEITIQGATIEVRIDRNLVFSVADSSFDQGTVALYSWYNMGSSFDDVLVQDLTTGSVLLSDDFNNGAFTGWSLVDEGTEQSPSAWLVNNANLVQSSNIGSSTTNNLGTYALY